MLPKLQVLLIAIALVDAINEDVHRDTGGDKLLGREVDGKWLRLRRHRDKCLYTAIAVCRAELL
jgi:hypothetical protein